MFEIGSANENRTRDFALRGRRLSRLTMAPGDKRKMAPGLGLEPRLEDPESPVLPLHHPGMYITYSTMDSLLCHSISISKNKRTVKEKNKKNNFILGKEYFAGRH